MGVECSGEVRMARQPGLFDLDERYAAELISKHSRTRTVPQPILHPHHRLRAGSSRCPRGVPAGRGGSAAHFVRGNPAPDRAAQTTAAAAPGMSIESNERRQPDGEVRR
jgi:hypothetical protein